MFTKVISPRILTLTVNRSAIEIQSRLKMAHQPAIKKRIQGPEESGVKLNDLPMLPFEKILNYLNVLDLIRSRAFSLRWCQTIEGFRVKRLFYSSRPIGFICEKKRLVSNAFAPSFISSPRIEAFESLVNTLGQSIFSSLKHLRFFKLSLNQESGIAFVRTLNSFGQLQELGLFRLEAHPYGHLDLELNLTLLTRIHLERVSGFRKLTLDTPKLQTVKLEARLFLLRPNLVRTEFVTALFLGINNQIEITKLKNLKYLYIGRNEEINSLFLSSVRANKANSLVLKFADEWTNFSFSISKWLRGSTW